VARGNPPSDADTGHHHHHQDWDHGRVREGREMADEQQPEGEPRQRAGERAGDAEGAGGHALAEREREEPRDTEEQHQTPCTGSDRHGESALLEVSLVEVQGRRLAGGLDRCAGVGRQVQPLRDRRGGVDVGDDTGAPRGVRREGPRLALSLEEMLRIAPRGDHRPELVAVRGRRRGRRRRDDHQQCGATVDEANLAENDSEILDPAGTADLQL
jgi:hypothetical protein